MRSRSSILFSVRLSYVLTVLCGIALVSVRAQDAGNAPGANGQQPSAGTTRSETIYIFARDDEGKAVTDLKAEELTLSVDGKPVQISTLIPAEKAPPLTLQVLLDVSGSRNGQLPGVERKYAEDFFQALLRPGDRAFVWQFSYVDMLLTSSVDSTDPEALAAGVAMEPSTHYGSTALFDAIFDACGPGLQYDGNRRAVLAVTDGGDNASKHVERDVEEIFRRENIQFFVINVGPATPDIAHPPQFSAAEIKAENKRALESARKLLRKLIDQAAGGSVEEVVTENNFHDALDHILDYLRNEYAVTLALPVDISKKKSRQFTIGTLRPGVTVVGPQEIHLVSK